MWETPCAHAPRLEEEHRTLMLEKGHEKDAEHKKFAPEEPLNEISVKFATSKDAFLPPNSRRTPILQYTRTRTKNN